MNAPYPARPTIKKANEKKNILKSYYAPARYLEERHLIYSGFLVRVFLTIPFVMILGAVLWSFGI